MQTRSPLNRTPVAALNAILAKMSAASKSLAIVLEGKDDGRIIGGFLSENACLLSLHGGKPSILRVAEVARRDTIENILFIVDKDFEDFCGQDSSEMNVVRSGTHDCFMDVVQALRSELGRIVQSIASGSKSAESDEGPISVVGHHDWRMALQLAVRVCHLICSVRIEDCKRGWALDFKRFNVYRDLRHNFTEQEVLEIVLQQAGSASEDRDMQIRYARGRASTLLKSNELYFGDHDFLNVLSWSLKPQPGLSEGTLRSFFIAALRFTDLCKVHWVNEMMSWCKRLGFEVCVKQSDVNV